MVSVNKDLVKSFDRLKTKKLHLKTPLTVSTSFTSLNTGNHSTSILNCHSTLILIFNFNFEFLKKRPESEP